MASGIYSGIYIYIYAMYGTYGGVYALSGITVV